MKHSYTSQQYLKILLSCFRARMSACKRVGQHPIVSRIFVPPLHCRPRTLCVYAARFHSKILEGATRISWNPRTLLNRRSAQSIPSEVAWTANVFRQNVSARGSLLSRVPSSLSLSLSFSASNFSPGTTINSLGLNQKWEIDHGRRTSQWAFWRLHNISSSGGVETKTFVCVEVVI